ncbi:Fido domain [Trinorchestia longiramus]|nr:Fido domain [Trinorchestia longiramus]
MLVTREPNDLNKALVRKESTDIEQKSDLSEAESCIRASERLIKAGRLSKAGKLLERAVALAPTLPMALLALGEYLEQHEVDIVRADLFYVRALMLSPNNPRAIRNRIRTEAIVASADYKQLETIDVKKLQLSHIPDSYPALKRIQNEAYFYHIHHTVAIEGNSMSVSEIRSILETGLSVGGKSVSEHTEVLGVDSALRFINSSLLHRVGSITLQDLLDIHLRVLGHTDPPAAGHLRTTQVFVGPHLPPAPSRLDELMQRFIAWLNDPASLALHPVRYAALAHYQLVYIHPFVDGNGRTARLLMNFLLMQAGYPPIIIRHQDRLEYYDTLQAANEGDTRPFVRFISHCTEKTLDVYLWATRDASRAIEQEDHSAHSSPKALTDRRHLVDVVNDVHVLHNKSPALRKLDLHDIEDDVKRHSDDQSLDADETTEQHDGSEDLDEPNYSWDKHGLRKHYSEYESFDELKEEQLSLQDVIGNEKFARQGLHKSETKPANSPSIQSRPFLEQNSKADVKLLKVSVEDPKLIESARLDHLSHLFVNNQRQEAGGGVHGWLSGGDASGLEYQRSSRYYSRLYLSPDLVDTGDRDRDDFRGL